MLRYHHHCLICGAPRSLAAGVWWCEHCDRPCGQPNCLGCRHPSYLGTGPCTENPRAA